MITKQRILRAAARRLTLAALGAAVFMIAAAPARSAVEFDASRHLLGFNEAVLSDYNYLYDLERFEKRKGIKMTPEELDAVCLEWEREQARVRDQIAAIEGSPTLKTLHFVDRALRHHRFFSRLAFRKDLSHDPVVLYIQEIANPHPRYYEKIAANYGPPLKRLVAAFDQKYAVPLNLEPRDGHGATVVFVLASAGDYSNFCGTLTGSGCITSGGCYCPDVRAGVVYEDAFDQDKRAVGARRQSALFVTAQSLLHRHRAFSEPPAAHAWLFDGTAAGLAWSCLDEVASGSPAPAGAGVERGALPAGPFKLVGEMLRDPAQRDAFSLTAAEILSIGTQEDAYRILEPRAARLQPPNPRWWGRGLALYQAQAAVFVRFLEEGEGGRFRQGLDDLMRKAMAEEKLNAKEGIGLLAAGADELHPAYTEYLAAQIATRCPEAALRQEDREAFAARHRPAGPAGGGAASPGAAATTAAGSIYLDSEFRPENLEPAGLAPEAAYGLALHAARRGRFQDALVRVRDAAAACPADSELRELAGRDLARLEALIALRRGFLDALAKSGKKLRLEIGGKNLAGEVAAVQDETFRMAVPGGGEQEFPLDVIDAAELARSARDKELLAGREWVAGYASLLAGNRGWQRYARGNSAEEADLKKDAARVEELLAAAAVPAAIAELARTPLPESKDAAEAIVEKIRDLLGEHGEAPAVDACREGLRQFAGRAFATIYDALDPQEAAAAVLKGKLERLPGGNVRVTYTFDDPAELLDFEPVEQNLDLLESMDMDPITTTAEETYFKIADGRLCCRGQGCCHLKVFLQAPLTVSYQLLVSTKGFADRNELPAGWFTVGFCDDGSGSSIQCMGLSAHLRAFHKPSGFDEFGTSEIKTRLCDTRYNIKVVHDGSTVTSYFDGVPAGTVRSGPLQFGGTFLWIYHDMEIRLFEMIFEGGLHPEFETRLRDEWILDRVASLDE